MSTNLNTSELEDFGYKQGPFLASIKRSKFHTLTCDYAIGLHAGNSFRFDTRAEAIDAGYKPCGTCYA